MRGLSGTYSLAAAGTARELALPFDRSGFQDNLDKLGVGPGFGLRFQSYTADTEGRQIIRVILTRGRGDGAQRLANHGVLVFRQDGSLMDYHGPLAPGI